MKYIAKFIVILSLFYLVILSTIAFLWYTETQTLDSAKQRLIAENKVVLTKLIDLKNLSYKTGVSDYTVWDEMVHFVTTKDFKWASINLEQFVLSYQYDYIYVYNIKKERIYSHSNHKNEDKVATLLDTSKLIRKPLFTEYYILVDGIPAKVFQAPIQPSEDTNRVSKPYGYLIGIKLIDQSYTDELENFLRQKIVTTPSNISNESDYTLPLLDSNNNLLANLSVSLSDSLLYDTVNHLFLKLILIILSIILLSLLVIFWLLTRQILLPLQKLTIVDTLTDVYNRRYFNEQVPRLLESAKRNDRLISFAMLDIDHFKSYNDHYGHQQGDDALKTITRELQKQLHRGNDYIFRLGGEEFAILFESSTETNAILFANLLKECVEKLEIPSTDDHVLTISIGLVAKPAHMIQNINQLYKEADDLLYNAKNSGRNQVFSNVSNS